MILFVFKYYTPYKKNDIQIMHDKQIMIVCAIKD